MIKFEISQYNYKWSELALLVFPTENGYGINRVID